MSSWIEKKIKGYYDWLYDNTSFSLDEMTGWFAIQTPFVGLMNDCIEVYVRKDGNRILLSDDGDTLSNLELCGVNVTRSSNMKNLLRKIELSFGVSIHNGEICTEANESNFFSKKHAMICAIQQVSDLKAPGRKTSPNMLSQDVKTYLEQQDIVFTQDFNIFGKSMNFNFNFQIAGKKDELVINTYNSLSQASATSLLFGIAEIRGLREERTGKALRSLVIVNEPPREDVASALHDYDCRLAMWPERGTAWNRNIFSVA